jgi:hypothetical protein
MSQTLENIYLALHFERLIGQLPRILCLRHDRPQCHEYMCNVDL